MQNWLDGQGWTEDSHYVAPKCTCGATKCGQDKYSHSTWCDIFIAPMPIADNCRCGVGNWHSPLCKNRVWPEEPKNKLLELQKYMQQVIDELNKIK